MLTKGKICITKFVVLSLLLVAFCAGIFFVFDTQRVSETNNISSETLESSSNLSGDDNAEAGTGDDVAEASVSSTFSGDSHVLSAVIWYRFRSRGYYSDQKTEEKEYTVTNGQTITYDGPFRTDTILNFKVKSVSIAPGYRFVNLNATYTPVASSVGYVLYINCGQEYEPSDIKDSGTQTDPGNSYHDVNFWASSAVNTYTIYFTGSGGTTSGGATSYTQSFTYDQGQNLYANSFSREGYVFYRWFWMWYSSDSAGMGVNGVYENQQYVSNLTTTHEDILFFEARWAPIITLEDTYSDGYGYGGQETIYAAPAGNGFYSDQACSNAITSVTTPTHPGYHNFSGYYTSDGTQVIDSSGNFLVSSSYFSGPTTLYAHYDTLKTFNFTVVACGPNGEITGVTCPDTGYVSSGDYVYNNQTYTAYTYRITYTATYNMSPVPTFGSYLFSGFSVISSWTTSFASGNNNQINITCSVPADCVAIPNWQAGKYNITFHKNDGSGATTTLSGVNSVAYDSNVVLGDITNRFATGWNNHIFKGWDADQDATSASLNTTSSYNNLATPVVVNNVQTTIPNVDLYAVWNIQFTVYAYYNTVDNLGTYTNGTTGGGVGRFSLDVTYQMANWEQYQTATTATAHTSANAHYIFMGWYPANGVTISGGTIISWNSGLVNNTTNTNTVSWNNSNLGVWYARFDVVSTHVYAYYNDASYLTLYSNSATGGTISQTSGGTGVSSEIFYANNTAGSVYDSSYPTTTGYATAKTHYTFMGWYPASSVTKSGDIITSWSGTGLISPASLTLDYLSGGAWYARFDVNTYEVTFKINGETTKTGTYGSITSVVGAQYVNGSNFYAYGTRLTINYEEALDANDEQYGYYTGYEISNNNNIQSSQGTNQININSVTGAFTINLTFIRAYYKIDIVQKVGGNVNNNYGGATKNGTLNISSRFLYDTSATIIITEREINNVKVGHFVDATLTDQSNNSSVAISGNYSLSNLTFSVSNIEARDLTLTLNFIPVWNSEVIEITVANDEKQNLIYTGEDVVPTQSQVVVRNKIDNEIIYTASSSTFSQFTITKLSNNRNVVRSGGNIFSAARAYGLSTNPNRYYLEQDPISSEYVVGGPVQFNYAIQPRDISGTGFSFVLSQDSFVFDNTKTNIQPTLSSATYTNSNSNVYNVTYSISSYLDSGAQTLTENVGTKVVTILGTGNYCGTKTLEYSVTPRDLSTANLDVTISSFVYTGQTLDPNKLSATQLVVQDLDLTDQPILVKGPLNPAGAYDFSVSTISGYDYTNAGTHKFKLVGYGNYENEYTVDLIINKFNLSTIETNQNYGISYSIDSFVYTGLLITPTPGNGINFITITISDVSDYPFASYMGSSLTYTLVYDTTQGKYDYSIFGYAQNINITKTGNQPKLTIVGQTNFEGSTILEFDITKKNITESLNLQSSSSVVYNGTLQIPTIGGNDTNLRNSDIEVSYYYVGGTAQTSFNYDYQTTCRLVFNNAGIFVEAHTYKIEITPTEGGNYGYYDNNGALIDGPYTLTYTITQRPITNLSFSIILDNDSNKVYATYTYNGNAWVLDYGNLYQNVVYGTYGTSGYYNESGYVYDGLAHTPQLIITDAGNASLTDDCYVLYNGDAPLLSITNYNDLAITIQAFFNKSSRNNYSAQSLGTTFSFDIIRKLIVWGSGGNASASLDQQSFLYCNDYCEPGGTVNVTGLASGANFTESNWSNFFSLAYNNNTNVTWNEAHTLVLAAAEAIITPTGNFVGDSEILNFTISPRSVLEEGNLFVFADGSTQIVSTYNGTAQTPTFRLLNHATEQQVYLLGNDVYTVDSNSNKIFEYASMHDISISVSYKVTQEGVAQEHSFGETFVHAGYYTLTITGTNNYTNSYTLTIQINSVTISGANYNFSYINPEDSSDIIVVSNGESTTKVYNANPYTITRYYITFSNSEEINFAPNDASTNGISITYSINNGANYSTTIPAENYWTNVTQYGIIIYLRATGTDYTGDAFLNFAITPYALSSLANYITIEDIIYTSFDETVGAQQPIGWQDVNNSLIQDLRVNTTAYYDLSYINNTTVGQAIVTITPKGNYGGDSFNKTFNIIPFTINVSTVELIVDSNSSLSFVYNAQSQQPNILGIKFTRADGNVVKQELLNGNGANVLYSFARTTGEGGTNNFVNVGDFSITVSIDNSSYLGTVLYQFGNLQTAQFAYSITPRTFNTSWINWNNNVMEATYDGLAHIPSITVYDGGLGIDITDQFVITKEAPSYITVKRDINGYVLGYSNSIAIKTANDFVANYALALNEDPANLSRNFVINPKAFDESKIGIEFTSNLVYNGQDQTPTYRVYDKAIRQMIQNGTIVAVANEYITDFVVDSISSDLKNAGTKLLIIKSNNAGNYYLPVNSQTHVESVVSANFEIARKSIASNDITVVLSDLPFDNTFVTPTGTITDTAIHQTPGDGGTVLISYTVSEGGCDYKLSVVADNEYSDGKEVGQVKVLVEGKNNYTDTRLAYFYITPVVLGQYYYAVIVLSEDEYTFDNTEHKPNVSVMYIKQYQDYNNPVEQAGDQTFFEITSFENGEISYTNPNNLTNPYKYVGTYNVVFNGNANYQIAQGYTPQTSYQITPKALEISMFDALSDQNYNTRSHKLTPQGSYNGYNLTNNTDFETTWSRGGVIISNSSDFVDAGTIVLSLSTTNSRNFSGSVELSYDITPRSLEDVLVVVNNNNLTFVYNGNEQTPPVALTDTIQISGMSPVVRNLTLGADFEVNYYVSLADHSTPVNAGTGYIIDIQGINNYIGSPSSVITYDVLKATISSVSLDETSGEYTRTMHTIVLDDVLTANSVSVSSSNFDVYFKTSAPSSASTLNDIQSLTDSDKKSVAPVYVIVVAKDTSLNFDGFAYTVYTITPATITSLVIPTDEVVYNTLDWKTNIFGQAVVSTSEILLQSTEFELKYYKNSVEVSNVIDSGTYIVKVFSTSPNFVPSFGGTGANSAPTATFVVNQKSLLDEDIVNAQHQIVKTIDINFFYADNDDPYDLGEQVYVGREIYAVVKYYYNGLTDTTHFVTLVGHDPNNYTVGDDFVFRHYPPSWTDATATMTLTIEALNGTNYCDLVEFTYVINAAPWNTTYIHVTIADQTYTASDITFDPTTTPSGTITAYYDVDPNDTIDPVVLVFGTDFVVDTSYNDTTFEIVNGYSHNRNVSDGALVVFKPLNPNYVVDPSVTFAISFKILSYNITNITSTLTLDTYSFTYNTLPQNPTFQTLSYNNETLQNGKDFDVVYTITGESNSVLPVYANGYTITVSGKGNYCGALSQTFTITPRLLEGNDLEFVWKNNDSSNKTYNGLAQKPQIVGLKLIVNNNEITIPASNYGFDYTYSTFLEANYQSISDAEQNFVNAGLYRIYLTSNSPNFVSATSYNATYQINRDVLTSIVLTPNSKLYDGSTKIPDSIVVNAQNNSNIDPSNYSISYRKYDTSNHFVGTGAQGYFVDAGTITYIVTVASGCINFVNNANEVSDDFEIVPRTLHASNIDVDDTGLVYDKKALDATVTVTDTILGVDVTLVRNQDYTLAFDDNIDAGTNTAQVTVEGINNYNYTLVFRYSIAKRNIETLVFNSAVVTDLSKEFTGNNISIDDLLLGVLTHNYQNNGAQSYNLTVGTDGDFEVLYTDQVRVNVKENLETKEYGFSLQGTGNYEGLIEGLSFTISPRALSNSSISIVFKESQLWNYTGEEIRPEIEVWDNGANIKDQVIDVSNLTISYHNNINVHWYDSNTFDAGAEVLVVGDNNYTLSKSATFTIVPISLASDGVKKLYGTTQLYSSIDSLSNPYYMLPTPQLYQGGSAVLINDDDGEKVYLTFNNANIPYQASYTNNTGKTTSSGLEGLAKAELTPAEINGVRNFVGTVVIYFEITDLSITMAELSFAGEVYYNAEGDYWYVYYNTQEQKLEPILEYENETLVLNVDYTVGYQSWNFDENSQQDFVNAYTDKPIEIYIDGKLSSRFSGHREVRYYIFPRPITQEMFNNNDVQVFGIDNTQVFSGEQITQDKENLTVKVNINNSFVTLDQSNFIISCTNNIDAGNEAILRIVMPTRLNNVSNARYNNYSGEFETTFVINPKEIETSMLRFAVDGRTYQSGEFETYYTGQNITPNVQIFFNERTYLEEGNFVVSYRGNKDVARLKQQSGEDFVYTILNNGAKALISTTGISGNFVVSGEPVEVFFTIKPMVIDSSDINFTLSEQQFVYDSIEHTPTITQLVINNEQLSLLNGLDEGDYRVLDYVNNTDASTDLLKAGIVIDFVKNYQGAGDGRVTLNFTIAKFNLENAIAVFDTLSGHVYDGTQHEVSVSLSFEDRYGNEHEIGHLQKTYSREDIYDTAEQKLVHAGTVLITVSTQESNFEGALTQTFVISPVNINMVQITLDQDPNIYVYKNEQIRPTYQVSYNNHPLSEALGDFVVSYGENINVLTGGTITFTPEDGGNVTGVAKIIAFEISPRSLANASMDIGQQIEFVYTGSAILPEYIKLSDLSINPELLVLGEDYTLDAITSNILPGIVSVVARGINNYDNSLFRNYTIIARSFSDVRFVWVDENGDEITTWIDENGQEQNHPIFTYTRAEHRPTFKLVYEKDNIIQELVMGEGNDFTVEYINAVNASTNSTLENKPKVKIKGVGGYKDDLSNIIEKTFEIERYNIQNILENKQLTDRKVVQDQSLENVILQELTSFLSYNGQWLENGQDYSQNVTGTQADPQRIFMDVGKLTFVITGTGNFKGESTLEMQILAKQIDSIRFVVDESTSVVGGFELTYRGYAYNMSFKVHAGVEIISQNGYEITFFDKSGNEVTPLALDLTNGTFELLDAQTLTIKVRGTGNYVGNTGVEANIVVKPMKLTSSNIQPVQDSIKPSVVYYFGVPQTQDNASFVLTQTNNETKTLTEGTDYTVSYYNNAYVGRAVMVLKGKGNFEGVRTIYYQITKRDSVANPYFENIVYYEGDKLPVLILRSGDTNGSITWDLLNEDINATLKKGTNAYTWTFYPNDTNNLSPISGTLYITALEIIPIRIDVYGDYKKEYNVFDKFDASNIAVYLAYNNGNITKLDKSEYILNVQDGQELYLGVTPVVRYVYNESTISTALDIIVSQIKLVVDFGEISNIIQTEQAQYITPVISNAVEGHAPSTITRYYSKVLNAYTDGITQSGEYIISVSVVGNDYIIDGENSVTIYVQTGVLRSSDGRIVVIDKEGFEDGLRLTVREYTSLSQIDGIIDTRTFSVKKCYEIQLWKDGKEYFSPHVLTIRFNLGRDILQGDISLLNIPSDTDIYYEKEFTQVDRDNVEVSSRVLGAFVFGEKLSFVTSNWWIILIAVLVVVSVGVGVLIVVLAKRRRMKMISSGINIKLRRN